MIEDGVYELELLRNEMHAPTFPEIIISLSLPFWPQMENNGEQETQLCFS